MNDPAGGPLIDGWILTAQGSAIHGASGTAVIADVHLGYEWSRGGRGEVIPAHSLAETTNRLAPVLDRGGITRLVVAGDLVETARPCRRTSRDVHALRRWLDDRGVELVALRGNHDPPGGPDSLEVEGWTIGHGHRPLAGPRRIIGHHHPALRTRGVAAPCFLVGPALIVLPAFSANAAGIDVTTAALPEPLLDPSLRCVAALDGELFDFGPRATLRARLACAIR